MTIWTTISQFINSPAGVALLFAVLLIGLWNMIRRPAGNTSQRLMRWRVGLQFAAICLIIGYLLLKR